MQGLGRRWACAGRHGRRAWALGVARRQAYVGARAGGSSALAQRALGRARQAGRRRAGRDRQAGAGALGVGARGARPGRGLGAWAGLGQCTRCIRPISDPF